MTPAELAQQVAADAVDRLKAADAEALLASEAITYGRFDQYIAGKVAEIDRRIDEQFGNAGTILN